MNHLPPDFPYAAGTEQTMRDDVEYVKKLEAEIARLREKIVALSADLRKRAFAEMDDGNVHAANCLIGASESVNALIG